MFNVLISANDTAWETDQLMRMPADRFKEYTVEAGEPAAISLDQPNSLKALETIPTLLLYESCVGAPNGEVARLGTLHDLRVSGSDLVFGFVEDGRLPRERIEQFADRLDIDPWQFNRTHWSVKEGGLPGALLREVVRSYDVVLSFAGEDRRYVERVAACLRKQRVRVFYDGFEEAELWGKDLAEHLDVVYRRAGTYCVLFISAAYKNKMWTRHERRAAFARALKQDSEYILPARFDDTDLAGVRPTLGYIGLQDKKPAQFAKILLRKLRP